MLDEESPGPERNEVQLFDECSPRAMSKRYTTAISLDHDSSKHKIAFETFDDVYLPEFFLEPETIEDLYLDTFFLKIEDNIPQSNMPSDELVVVVNGKSTVEFSANSILCQFSFNRGAINSVHGAATNLCIWDPGISFKFKVRIGYTVNTNPPLLLGSTGTFGFIAYNSATQVWDPEQQMCMHSSILLFIIALAIVTSLNFSSRDTFAKWAVADKMVVTESKVDDTYSEVNDMFDDSSQRVVSREIQPIAPLDIIRLPKLFRFLQQLLAQRMYLLQAPKSKEGYAAIEGDVALRKKIIEQATNVSIAWLQGCIKSMAHNKAQELRNFSTLEEIMVYFGAQGVSGSYATDHWSLIVIESELELVTVASIVVAYVVHKAMLNESKNTSILVSCGTFKTTTSLMRYLAHFGGHRRIEERIVAQQVLESNLVLKVLHNVSNTILIKFSSHHGISGQIQLAELGKTYGGITDAHDTVNIKKELILVGLNRKEQMPIFRIVAFVMLHGNREFSKGNEIVSSILQVDRVCVHLCTTITTLYTHSSLGRFNITLPAWLYSNLEDKVLIEEGSIVVNPECPEAGQAVGPGANPRRGPKIRKPNNRFIWDPG